MATLLRWVFDAVSARQGGPPDAMAVTYPANWGEYRKEIFGQAVRQIDVAAPVLVTEPEAAAIRYAALSRIQSGQAIGVYDLGGGTFDAAVLQREGNEFQLVGRPAGIEQLGGVDFDDAVFDHVRRTVGERALEVDLTDPAVVAALHQLRRDCVLAKEALSHDVETAIPVNLPGTNTIVRLTRGEFEDTIRPLLLETVGSFRRSLESAGCDPQDLAAVLLAGGSSRIPLVAELLAADLGRPVAVNADPKQIVAMGPRCAWPTFAALSRSNGRSRCRPIRRPICLPSSWNRSRSRNRIRRRYSRPHQHRTFPVSVRQGDFGH